MRHASILHIFKHVLNERELFNLGRISVSEQAFCSGMLLYEV